MLIIDKYAYTNRLTNSNPFIKFVIVAIALVIATITKNNYINLLVFAIMFFLTTIVAQIPISKYLRFLFIPSTFLLLSIASILISISKVNIYILSVRILDYYVGLTSCSLNQTVLLITRVFAAISATFFLGLTTPLNKLVKVFKILHVPSVVIELIVLIYRFIFILLEEANNIHNGQELKFGYMNFRNSLRSFGLLVRSLIVRVLISYEDMVVVLECKLYDGEFRTGD